MPKINGSELQDGQELIPAAEARIAEDLSADEVYAAVREARGDIENAARALSTTVGQLDRALSMSRRANEMARLIGKFTMRGKKISDRYLKQIENRIERKAVFYRSEAMDVLMQIASMPLTDNAYHNQIKMQAAMKLVDIPRVQTAADAKQSDDIAITLRLLNEEFQKNAPRLRVIRETVREMAFEDGATADGSVALRTIEAPGS
jgi:hypothetical protein